MKFQHDCRVKCKNLNDHLFISHACTVPLQLDKSVATLLSFCAVILSKLTFNCHGYMALRNTIFFLRSRLDQQLTKRILKQHLLAQKLSKHVMQKIGKQQEVS